MKRSCCVVVSFWVLNMYNRQYYIIPKPPSSLRNASNCLSIISGLLSRTIRSIGKTPQIPCLYKSLVDWSQTVLYYSQTTRQPSEYLKLLIHHFRTSFRDYPVNRKHTIDSLSLQIFSGLIIDSTILFPNHQIAFGIPQTAYPSFPDFFPGLSGQQNKHYRVPIFINLQCIEKLSGDAQTVSFEINNNSKSPQISRHIYIP